MATKKTSTPTKTTAKKAPAKKAPVKKVSAKKATTTKTTPKKGAAKSTAPKKTAAKAVSSIPKTPVNTSSQNNSGLFHVIYVVIIALLLAMLAIEGLNLDKHKKGFDTEQDFVVQDGRTWIPVPGNPVELIVLNDATCGDACDTSQAISTIKQNVTPALITRTVDIASKEGEMLVDQFGFVSIPAYILGEGASTFERDGIRFVDQTAGIFDQKGDLYAFNARAGFPTGKFIQAPEINIEGEPQLGNGPVTVIEFTDFQCPFCKRLHDNTSGLMDELVAEGKVTYVLKDFPLPFHKEAMPVHAALNCVQADAGNEAYFAMKETIFADQAVWGSQSSNDLIEYLVDLGSDNGASDISACITSQEANEEIAADIAEGSKYGVSGTPGIFVGSQFVPGAISADQLRAMIEAEAQ